MAPGLTIEGNNNTITLNNGNGGSLFGFFEVGESPSGGVAAALNLMNANITGGNNAKDGGGGAIAIFQGASVTINNTLFAGNQAIGNVGSAFGSGGAIGLTVMSRLQSRGLKTAHLRGTSPQGSAAQFIIIPVA